MKDIIGVIHVRNYATNTAISGRDLDQLVARIKRHHPVNKFGCYEVKRKESERPAAAGS